MKPKHIERLAELNQKDFVGTLTPDETAERDRLRQQHRQAFPHLQPKPKPTDPFHRELADELRAIADKVERGDFRFLTYALDHGLTTTVVRSGGAS